MLVQEAGVTEEGFPVDETGKVSDLENLGMDTLEPQLESMLSSYDGEWSVYVKNLDTDEVISINNKPMYSASLIKAFVMAKTYADMDLVLENQAEKMKAEPDSPAVQEKVYDLLWNMITVSENESCNELGRLQDEKSDSLKGGEGVIEYMEKKGNEDNSYQHTLHPPR